VFKTSKLRETQGDIAEALHRIPQAEIEAAENELQEKTTAFRGRIEVIGRFCSRRGFPGDE
jgi:hypothetical protein